MPRSHTLSRRPASRSQTRGSSPHNGSRKNGFRRGGQKWTRWLHVYSSMIALLVALFFSATGLTLNHPEWTFGLDPVTETWTGSVPLDAIGTDGTVEFLLISDFLRAEHGIEGEVTDYGITDLDGYISYRGPGYSADVFFETDTGDYEVHVEEQGAVAVLNDLHKGRDTTSSWNWLIDVSAIFLIVISLTGLGLQLFLSKRRKQALTIAGLGALLTLAFMLFAVS